MFKKHPEQIRTLVQSIIRQNGLETPLLEKRILDSWDEVAGKVIARYTTEKFIRNQTLFVRIQNPALRSELSMMKTDLINKLNWKVGARIVYEIRLI